MAGFIDHSDHEAAFGDAHEGAAARAEPENVRSETCQARQTTTILIDAIEGEIIPRLLLARRAAEAASTGTLAPLLYDLALLDDRMVAEYAELILAQETEAADAFIDRLRGLGTSIEVIYLELLAPVARHLGELWEADLCDFAQVTLALASLQRVLHALSPGLRCEVPGYAQDRRILLIASPGEQHTFGLSMVAEFFRRFGWDVWSQPVGTVEEVAKLVRREPFAIAGLSIACERQMEGLSGCIRAIRRSSRNRSIGVMVGGPLFKDHPERVMRVGADATAADGRAAVLQANDLLIMLSRGS